MSPRIAVVIGSTRPGRKGEAIGRWVYEIASAREDMQVELVDIAEQHLPLLDEPVPPVRGNYTRPHTLAWAETIAGFDGFVFVVGEYNHSAPAAVKNAVDYLYVEWNDKAAGFVSYGVDGGVRSVEQLRQTLATLRVATVATSPALRLFGDIGPDGRPTDDRHAQSVTAMLDQLVAWSGALVPLRRPAGSLT